MGLRGDKCGGELDGGFDEVTVAGRDVEDEGDILGGMDTARRMVDGFCEGSLAIGSDR